MLTMTVRQILARKGPEIISTTPETSVLDALALMAERNIGALLVLSDGEPVGMFTERDYARKIILRGKASKDTPVSAVMTSRVLGVGPDQTVEECMAIMTDKRIRHLPVSEDGKLLGMISIGDVVRSLIDEQRFVIQQLENYITGAR